MAEAPLTARPAFAGLLHRLPPSPNAGVVVRERVGMQLATVTARRGPRDALAAGIEAALGLGLPDGPKRVSAGSRAVLGTGPRSWLVTEEGGHGLARELGAALGSAAAVCDQSDGYAVLRLGGPRVRATLAKGLGIDLHPRAFPPDGVAVSVCSLIGVTIWQVDDAPTFELATFRSYAGSFVHWLVESAEEFGLRVDDPRSPPGR